jgi:hypothetical protein
VTCSTCGEKGNLYTLLNGGPEGKRLCGRHAYMEEQQQMELRKMGCTVSTRSICITSALGDKMRRFLNTIQCSENTAAAIFR